MSNPPRPPRPPVVPYLVVSDGAEALAFYERALGASILVRDDFPDGRLRHATVAVNGGIVMVSNDMPEVYGKERHPKALGGSGVTIHLDVANADAVFNKAVEAGAKVVLPLADMFWGDRYGVVEDPFGHLWSMSSRLGAAR